MHQILEILAEEAASAGPDLVSLDDLKAALGITGFSEDAALEADRKSTRLNSSHCTPSRMPSSA